MLERRARKWVMFILLIGIIVTGLSCKKNQEISIAPPTALAPVTATAVAPAPVPTTEPAPVTAQSLSTTFTGMAFISTNEQGYKEYLHAQTGMVFVLIKGGTFKMGSNESNYEKPIHEVTISDFLIGKYEVTQGQWQKIMSSNPANFKKGDDYPVEQVSWNDCQDFCSKSGLRLPTEAEWEYAGRAGTSTKYYWGDSVNDDYLWYNSNSGSSTHPVGQKKPNGFGLYDMSGNVWEWCADWSDANYYQSSPKSNPKGPASGQYRVLRGGGWLVNVYYCRSARRSRLDPTFRDLSVGLRVVQDSK